MIGIRQILVILGVILVVRLIGKAMTARRNIRDQKTYQQQQDSAEKYESNIGKTTISKVDKKELKNGDFTTYEEVD